MQLRMCLSPVPCRGHKSPQTGEKWLCCMQCKIWLRVPGFLRVLRTFYRQMHPLALLPSKGYCVLHMVQSALPTVHGLLLLLLLLTGLPCPQSHPSSPEPEPPPQYPPHPAPDDSIAIDSCDSDREIDCDADNVASFEALDEA